jgi:hypothetical protein
VCLCLWETLVIDLRQPSKCARRWGCSLYTIRGPNINPDQRGTNSLRTSTDVRFGSKADIEAPSGDVRFTPKADIAGRRLDVRLVPKADISPLFDHLISAGEQRGWEQQEFTINEMGCACPLWVDTGLWLISRLRPLIRHRFMSGNSVRQSCLLKSISVPRDIFRPSKRRKVHGSRQRRYRIELANASNNFLCFFHFSGKAVACNGNS